MTSREVIKALRAKGARLVRQSGSHQIWRSACGTCVTTVPVHMGKDIKRGTLHGIETDMQPCYGKGWLT